ncbi:MAG: hypothetical protein ACHRXM_37815 [Isosphaerales bacterium]
MRDSFFGSHLSGVAANQEWRDPQEAWQHALISTLRQIYGANFAPAFGGHGKLSDVLLRLDRPSLRKLVDDLKKGKGQNKAKLRAG